MIRVLFIGVFFYLATEVSGQTAWPVKPGLYSLHQKFGKSGLYLLRKDSTFLYFGFGTTHPSYTTNEGTWMLNNDSLILLSKPITQPFYFYTNPITYTASSKPSFDSLYFEIEVTDSLARSAGYTVQIGNKVISVPPSETFRQAFNAKETGILNSITVIGGVYALHTTSRSSYSSVVNLQADHNFHQIKMERQVYSTIPFVPSEASGRMQFGAPTSIKGDTLYYGAYERLVRINNVETILPIWFTKARGLNPSFKPYFDWLEAEFRKEQ